MQAQQPSIIGRLHVLVISMSPACWQIVRAALSQEPLLECLVAECENLSAAKAQLEHHEFDLIIVDTNIEDLRSLAEQAKNSAVVFLARTAALPTLEEAIAAGATDYFAGADYGNDANALWLALRQTIRYHAIKRQRLHLAETLRQRDTQMVNLTQRLWRTLPYDFRTGWYTHRQVLQRLKEEIHRARRYSLPLCLVLVDFEGLMELQRDAGQEICDQAISELSSRTRLVARQTDLVGHYGSDSFLILLTNTPLAGARKFCDRVAKTLKEPIAIGQRQVALGCTFGVVQLDETSESTELLGRAELFLEQARSAGKIGAMVTD